MYTDQMKHRLHRVEGQVRGILGMMEEGRPCREVVHQLSAARSAVDRVILQVVAEHMEECIQEAEREGRTARDVIDEAFRLLVSSR